MADGVFRLGDVTLSSGRASRYKIECDAWTDGDVECLAYLIARLVGPFDYAHGVPRGGLRLADALAKYSDPVVRPGLMKFQPDTCLLVDDVLTTGGSLGRLYGQVANEQGRDASGARVVGAVVYARGPCPSWVRAVCTIDPDLWGE